MIIRDLLLVGGGHSHLFVLESFARAPVEGLRLTLISAHSHAAYSGMLPGLVAGHYDFHETHVDLRKLAACAGARFIRAEVCGIDPSAHQILLTGRPCLSYDLCSINSGGTPAVPSDGAMEHDSIGVKPVDRFLAWLEDLERLLRRDRAPLRVAVVGAGAGGVELILALAQRFRDCPQLSLSLLEQASEILPSFPRAAREVTERALCDAGVALYHGAKLTLEEGRARVLSQGETLEFDRLIFTTGIRPAPWIVESGLDLDKAGFIAVDATLRSTSHHSVFAAGDVASQIGFARPKAGVFAVRQGPILAQNLKNAVRERSLTRFRPQGTYLTILAQGSRRATAVRNGLVISGDWVWRWKDRIDRRFMERFAVSGAMKQKPSWLRPKPLSIRHSDRTDLDMQCAGCGAKVPGDVLDAALSRLGAHNTPIHNPVGRDDAHVLLPPEGHEIVQSIDFFPALISDPFLFGQIAAAHALSDLYAMGARPLLALANAVVARGEGHIQGEDLYQMLAGAQGVLRGDGALLAGGHSSVGDTPGLGFAVTGHLPKGSAIAKRGLTAGDALILTKPIGGGAIFAAAMRHRADACWIDKAIDSMRRSNKSASEILRHQGVHAMTDVTGFGLGGHLAEMLDASGLTAEIDLAAIPLFEGLRDVLEAGIESSLAPANKRLVEKLVDPTDGISILSDPQTSGGLLAALPGADAGACLKALHAAGDQEAAIIGTVKARAPAGPVIRLKGDLG